MRPFRFLAGVTTLALLAATAANAKAGAAHGTKKQLFEDALLTIEYNSSGPDVGVQFSADAEAWSSLKIYDPHNKKLVDIFTKGPVGTLGLSELFTESDEPSLDDLPLEDFLALFPEGQYVFTGETPDGEKISGRATLTHIIPDPPVITGPPAAPQPASNVIVSWQPVPDPPGSAIERYQVILEHGEAPTHTFSVDVPPSVHSVKITPEYLQPGTHYGFEVIVWETGGNHTITEGHFDTQ
jgi:fibronectin type III domain protein